MTRVEVLGPAKRRILSSLRDGAQSAGTVAAHLHIQTSAARRHLERLVHMGIVKEEFVRATRGRPKKVYALTEEGRELFPRRYDAVLDGLLGNLVAKMGPEAARRHMMDVAEALARTASEDSSRKRIANAVALLSDLGFEASAERAGRTVVITSRNCPLLRTAMSHRDLVCAGLHEELIRRTTGARRIVRGKWIVDGDSVCTHTIET